MQRRITQNQLEGVVDTINKVAGNDHKGASKGWIKQEDGTYRAHVGAYVLGWGYGGVRLEQITNESGGTRDVTARGTKREVYHMAHSFLDGLVAALESKRI